MLSASMHWALMKYQAFNRSLRCGAEFLFVLAREPKTSLITGTVSISPKLKISIPDSQIAMTPDVFTLEGGSANHASITYLNLHSNSIRKIENLSGLVSLQTLILSFNEISKMEGMETFSKLTRLDLSFNVVRRLEGLKNLSTLTKLEMNSNMIHRAEDLSMLRKYCGGLLALNFAGNPVCDMKSYRQYVLRCAAHPPQTLIPE